MILKVLIGLLFVLPGALFSQQLWVVKGTDMLPDGTRFAFWEDSTNYRKVYYVSAQHPAASDSNPGTKDRPFRTIQRAAAVLQPGEKVLIGSGVYRECIRPPRGGINPSQMIAYEAAPGAEVVIDGNQPLPASALEPSAGWKFLPGPMAISYANPDTFKVYRANLSVINWQGYNPFGMLNLMGDWEWLQYQKVNMNPSFRRRGAVYVDGIRLRQVLRPVDLGAHADSGAYWVEHNGLALHLLLPGGKKPGNCRVEVSVQEQLFVPTTYGTGYIRVQGLQFRHAANGFPVPQRGMLSTARGHHWIVQDCIFEQANAIAVDMGNEMWHTITQSPSGHHIFRGNTVRDCGIGGLQIMKAPHILVEDNLFENIGWQQAEHIFEAGAIKFHEASDCLLRRNVFRYIRDAPGIWLDYLSNQNCRITHNLFADIGTARGAIYVEVSHGHCRIDHNVFWKMRSRYWLSGEYGAGGAALYTDGSDSIDFDHNLMADIENTGYLAYLNAERLVGGRGGITRWHRVTDNIFHDCGKRAIEFANEHQFSDRNIYSHVPDGYIRIGNPAPSLQLDIPAVQKLFGWERSGIRHLADLQFLPDRMLLRFTGKPVLANGQPGPFGTLRDSLIWLDPRKK